METKLVRIADISATSKHPIFTSVYHLINEDMLKQCHKELDGNKAVGIDKVTKDEYGKNLDRNIKDLVQRLKNKSFKPLPSLRVYIPKANGKKRPLGIASYEDKIVQMAVKNMHNKMRSMIFLLFRIRNAHTGTGWNVPIPMPVWIVSAEKGYLLSEQKKFQNKPKNIDEVYQSESFRCIMFLSYRVTFLCNVFANPLYIRKPCTIFFYEKL